jgi:hypothetical protein
METLSTYIFEGKVENNRFQFVGNYHFGDIGLIIFGMYGLNTVSARYLLKTLNILLIVG